VIQLTGTQITVPVKLLVRKEFVQAIRLGILISVHVFVIRNLNALLTLSGMDPIATVL
jgi:hypothetical protein